jgi:hypothetical protein
MEETSEIAAGIRVFVVAWGLYWISSRLDWFWNLAYRPGPRPGDPRRHWFVSKLLNAWRTLRTPVPGFIGLERRRDEAMRTLKQRTSRGLYVNAREAITAEQWAEHVQTPLALSKAFRAFVIPFFVAWAVMADASVRSGDAALLEFGQPFASLHVFDGFRADFTRASERLDFFTDAWVPAALCAVCAVMYVWLRIRHMNKLYTLVSQGNAAADGRAATVA